jgi:hypothetical protein
VLDNLVSVKEMEYIDFDTTVVGNTVQIDGTQFNVEGYTIQGDIIKEIELDPQAKNVVYFEYLKDGLVMPEVQAVKVSKVNRATGTYVKATVVPTDIKQDVVWVSSDEDIATVDEEGKITQTGTGVVKITAISQFDGTSEGSIYFACGTDEDVWTDANSNISIKGIPAGVDITIENKDQSEHFSRLAVYDELLNCFDVSLTAQYATDSSDEPETVDVYPITSVSLDVPLGVSFASLQNELLFVYRYSTEGGSYKSLDNTVDKTQDTVTFEIDRNSRIEMFGPLDVDASGTVAGTPSTSEKGEASIVIRPSIDWDDQDYYIYIEDTDTSDKTGANTYTGDVANADAAQVVEAATEEPTVVGITDTSTFDDNSGSKTNSSDSSQSGISQALASSANADTGFNWKSILPILLIALFAIGGAISYAVYLKKGPNKRRWGIC